jgi:eukaryotic-like serine/threonine-protein kinase
MKFIHNSGQRPLDGYTIKRGIGRGGFGEVYYAVSDGGKEVALKLVRGGNMEIELRGMAQCLNLKHPHLVSLYDIKTDPQGDHWVVMEYIAGEPLSVVLSRHPQGLPHELAQQWFLALSRAVGYLHDHGIVHRDLKPANIFLENGIVKVGDYGLCKFISGSQRNAQTQSVGTVHYMAPEISTGNYNRQIDIYATGIILYEMLTGRVPFEGESAGEILMKHLTTPPDLSKLPADYVNVVGKALAKNPAHRYASLAEMAKVVEGLGKPAPAARNAGLGARIERPAEVPPQPPRPEPRAAPLPPRPANIPSVLPVPSLPGQIAELCGSLVLSVILAAMATMLWTAIGQGNLPWSDIGQEFFLTVAACWAVLIPAKFWTNRRGDAWVRRLVMMVLGLGIGFGSIWLEGWSPHLPAGGMAYAAERPGAETPLGSALEVTTPNLAGHLCYFALAFFALRWWKLADRRRAHRFSFAPILAAGFWGLALLLVWQNPWQGTLVLTTAAAIVQLVSPWEQPPPAVNRRMRLRYA